MRDGLNKFGKPAENWYLIINKISYGFCMIMYITDLNMKHSQMSCYVSFADYNAWTYRTWSGLAKLERYDTFCTSIVHYLDEGVTLDEVVQELQLLKEKYSINSICAFSLKFKGH